MQSNELKNADIDKNKYFGFGISFDRTGSFSSPADGFGSNAIIFGVDMSSSVRVDNKKKYIFILDEGPTEGRWYNINWKKKLFN